MPSDGLTVEEKSGHAGRGGESGICGGFHVPSIDGSARAGYVPCERDAACSSSRRAHAAPRPRLGLASGSACSSSRLRRSSSTTDSWPSGGQLLDHADRRAGRVEREREDEADDDRNDAQEHADVVHEGLDPEISRPVGEPALSPAAFGLLGEHDPERDDERRHEGDEEDERAERRTPPLRPAAEELREPEHESGDERARAIAAQKPPAESRSMSCATQMSAPAPTTPASVNSARTMPEFVPVRSAFLVPVVCAMSFPPVDGCSAEKFPRGALG